MTPEQLSKLTDQEVLAEVKKNKSKSTVRAGSMGFLIGIAIYSTVKNGLGFFTFFPLFFAYLIYHNSKKSKALKEELNSRNL